MIDMTQPVTVTKTGLDVMTHVEHQFFTFGKILLARKKDVVVLVSAGPMAGKKVVLPNVFPAVVDGVTYAVDVPDEPNRVFADNKRVRPVGGETKISVCKRIFAEMQGGVIGGSDKAAIVARFVSEANCTPAGANTYYITCMKA